MQTVLPIVREVSEQVRDVRRPQSDREQQQENEPDKTGEHDEKINHPEDAGWKN
jgi:hypothetical protein